MFTTAIVSPWFAPLGAILKFPPILPRAAGYPLPRRTIMSPYPPEPTAVMAKSSNKTVTKKIATKPRTSATAGDDTAITAFALPPEPLSPEMVAYFEKCEEKLGFVPNVLKAYAFDNAKLSAFVAIYNDLMLAPSGLSKLEREMIAVAVSSYNRCYYCLVAHGAAVRALSGDPALGELMVMNYRAALGRRGRGPGRLAPGGLQRSRYLGHRRCRRLFQHVEPDRVGDRHAAEQRLSWPGTVNGSRGASQTNAVGTCGVPVASIPLKFESLGAGRKQRQS